MLDENGNGTVATGAVKIQVAEAGTIPNSTTATGVRPGFVDVHFVLDAFQADLSVYDRLLLITLATWSDKSGMCFPSLPKIAERSGLDERTIRRGLARLEQMGRLSLTRRNRKVSLIRLHRISSDVDVPSWDSSSDVDVPSTSDIDVPVYSHGRTQTSDIHVPLTKEASNQEREATPPEPERFCERHRPYGSGGAPCGPCGSARIGHEAWEKTYRPKVTDLPTITAPRFDPTPMCDKHPGYPNTRIMPCEACKREQE